LAAVTADTRSGIYVAPSGEDGSLGAWVRQVDGNVVYLDWYGIGTNTANDRLSIQHAASYLYSAGGGTVLFNGSKTYAFNNVYMYSNVEFDFNYCNLRLIEDSDYSFNCLFVTCNGQPGTTTPGNPLNSLAEYRYDLHFPDTTGYTDAHEPLDTGTTIYPAGTTTVTMAGALNDISEGDWVFFCSGPHDGLHDWTGYQHFEMEICKIAYVSGTTVSFEEPTKMTHRLKQSNAFDTGESQYGAVAWWTLSKIQDNTVSENVTFRRLRMEVAQTGWTSTKRLFRTDFAYNLLFEDNKIHVPEDASYAPEFYFRGRNVVYRNNTFSGKWGLCTGMDMGQVGHLYENNKYAFYAGNGYVHHGERFASCHFIGNHVDYGCTATAGSPGASAFFYTSENDDIVIENNTFANAYEYFGYDSGTFTTPDPHVSCIVRGNKLMGYWLQNPVRCIRVGSNFVFEDNTLDLTVSTQRTFNLGFTYGKFTGNRFNMVDETASKTNLVGWVNFADTYTSAGTECKSIFRDNYGIADVTKTVIAGESLFSTGATVVTWSTAIGSYQLPGFVTGATNSAYCTIDCHTRDEATKMGIVANIYGTITGSTSTADIRLITNVGTPTDLAAMTQPAVTYDLTGDSTDTPALAQTLTRGTTADTGLTTDTFQLGPSRIGGDAADTYGGTWYLVYIEAWTFPSQGS
jgi:hypothetical protein